MSRNYTVGKGKPPVHTRFKKGQSGNPSGRPKGKVATADVDAVLNEALTALVTVNEGGRSRKIKKIKALCTRTVNEALKGNNSTMRLLFAHLGRRSDHLTAQSLDGQSKTDDEAKQELEQYFDQIRARMSNGASSSDGQNGNPSLGVAKNPGPEGGEAPPKAD